MLYIRVLLAVYDLGLALVMMMMMMMMMTIMVVNRRMDGQTDKV